jgi:hypothetical protein
VTEEERGRKNGGGGSKECTVDRVRLDTQSGPGVLYPGIIEPGRGPVEAPQFTGGLSKELVTGAGGAILFATISVRGTSVFHVSVCLSVCRPFPPLPCSDKGDFMSRSLSLYCHSDTGPTGPTALILRDRIRSSFLGCLS